MIVSSKKIDRYEPGSIIVATCSLCKKRIPQGENFVRASNWNTDKDAGWDDTYHINCARLADVDVPDSGLLKETPA